MTFLFQPNDILDMNYVISNCALATYFGESAAHVFDFVCATYWRHVSLCRLAHYVFSWNQIRGRPSLLIKWLRRNWIWVDCSKVAALLGSLILFTILKTVTINKVFFKFVRALCLLLPCIINMNGIFHSKQL